MSLVFDWDFVVLCQFQWVVESFEAPKPLFYKAFMEVIAGLSRDNF